MNADQTRVAIDEAYDLGEKVLDNLQLRDDEAAKEEFCRFVDRFNELAELIQDCYPALRDSQSWPDAPIRPSVRTSGFCRLEAVLSPEEVPPGDLLNSIRRRLNLERYQLIRYHCPLVSNELEIATAEAEPTDPGDYQPTQNERVAVREFIRLAEDFRRVAVHAEMLRTNPGLPDAADKFVDAERIERSLARRLRWQWMERVSAEVQRATTDPLPYLQTMERLPAIANRIDPLNLDRFDSALDEARAVATAVERLLAAEVQPDGADEDDADGDDPWVMVNSLDHFERSKHQLRRYAEDDRMPWFRRPPGSKRGKYEVRRSKLREHIKPQHLETYGVR